MKSRSVTIGSLVRSLILAALVFVIGGCSTTVKFYATGATPPLCRAGAHKDSVAVYWGTAWRADQKEVARREAMVATGLSEFFGGTSCFTTVSLLRTVNGRDPLVLTDPELLASAPVDAGRIFVIRVEELGPNLMFYLSPILWETRNDVVLRVRSLNTRSKALESDVTVRWTRGGAFTMLGTNSLPPDFSGALAAVFTGQRLPQPSSVRRRVTIPRPVPVDDEAASGILRPRLIGAWP
jgi:hypothetical protein